MEKTLKENLTSRQVWQRGGYILIFALFYGLSKIFVSAIVIFQFASLLITRGSNARLADFSQSLAIYIYRLLQYMMCNSDEKPFPFSDWPASKVLTDEAVITRKKATRKKASSKKKTTTTTTTTSDKNDAETDLPEQQD